MLNVNAVVFWAFLAGVGYLISGTHGALVGLVIGLGVSVAASLRR